MRNKKFENIQNKILEDIYNRIKNKKKRLLEEYLNLRITMINKLCEVDSKEDLNKILKDVESLLMCSPKLRAQCMYKPVHLPVMRMKQRRHNKHSHYRTLLWVPNPCN